MGGAAVEDEMEKRKHTPSVTSGLSAFLCLPVSAVDLIRFGRRWQRSRCRKKPINAVKAARAKPLANHASLTPYPRVSLSLSVSLPLRPVQQFPGSFRSLPLCCSAGSGLYRVCVSVCVCLGKTVWLVVCVWASRGPTRETLTGRRRTALNKAHVWQLEEPVSAARN